MDCCFYGERSTYRARVGSMLTRAGCGRRPLDRYLTRRVYRATTRWTVRDVHPALFLIHKYGVLILVQVQYEASSCERVACWVGGILREEALPPLSACLHDFDSGLDLGSELWRRRCKLPPAPKPYADCLCERVMPGVTCERDGAVLEW